MKRNIGVIVIAVVIVMGLTALVQKSERQARLEDAAPLPEEAGEAVIGNFTGTVSGMATRLVLLGTDDRSAEGTYSLTRNGDMTEGSWTTLRGSAEDPDATVYQLDPDGPTLPRYYQVVDGATIEELDGELRPQEPREDFRLAYEHAPTIRSVYPLPASLGWNAAVETVLNPGEGLNLTGDVLRGHEIVSVQAPETDSVAAVTQGVRTYYEEKLASAGWTEDDALSADGAGSSVRGYRRGEEVIILSYESEFLTVSPDAPSQCPCRVTFRIFAGTREAD